MLTKIKINGFKSFHNFEMEFSPFTVIAGANASGKSNLFDALKLLSRLAESDNLKNAFREQRGEFVELFTNYGENTYAEEMSFEVEMLLNKAVKDDWGGEETLKYTRLRYALTIARFTNDIGMEDLKVVWEHLENLKHQQDEWLKIVDKQTIEHWRPKVSKGKRGIPYIQTIVEDGQPLSVEVPQDGTQGNKRRFPLNNAKRTVLSTFDTVDFPHVLAAKEEMKSWRFLEFNPEDLRQPTGKNNADDELSVSGKNLAAVLYRINQEDPHHLTIIARRLQTFLPDFIDVAIIDDKENKQYIIKLKDKDKREYTSRVLSEGTLRILALCILEHYNQHTGLLCFEEPENGIHPFRIKDVIRLLKALTTDFLKEDMPLRQVIVNTHSPVLVGNIYTLKGDNLVTIWYAEMQSRVTDINAKRMKLSVTAIRKVEKEEELPLRHFDAEEKLTLTKIKEYLNTVHSNS